MSRVLHPLLLLIFARVTHHELARMVQCLNVENAILGSKLPRVFSSRHKSGRGWWSTAKCQATTLRR